MKLKSISIYLNLVLFSIPIQMSAAPLAITNPINANSVPELVNDIVTAILAVVGAIALAMFIFGGVMWMTSAGNQTRIEKGRETLIWATIGLLIIFGSYAILGTILKAFEKS